MYNYKMHKVGRADPKTMPSSTGNWDRYMVCHLIQTQAARNKEHLMLFLTM
jgi:hypothetical protein